MARVVVVGAGIGGQLAALLLAPEHEVVLLERDPAPPPELAPEAWASWERRGVGQFRLLHFFQPRLRILLEQELPDVVKALDAAGALRLNPIANAPAEMTGGFRDSDEAFEALTARRPVYEAALAGVVAASSVEVRRGTAVAGLLTGTPSADGIPHVVGVRTDDGDEIRGDLVVDATGRRSPLPRWLADLGARAPEEELEDLGFVYYGRHFGSSDGSVPFAFGPPLMHHGSFSVLTLPADNGTWGMGFTCAADDAALRGLKDVDRWTALAKSLPLVAHWLDGEPLDENVLVMAKLEDRHRRYVVDGSPVATGVVAVADTWACTNPSVGRGATIGALHSLALRDVLRTADVADPLGFADAFDDATMQTVEPWYRATQHYDRHRLGAMVAAREGVPYEPGDPMWDMTCALERGGMRDPEVLRAFVKVASLLALPDEVVSAPGVFEAAIKCGTGPEAEANDPPGPNRAELVPRSWEPEVRVGVDGVGIEVAIEGEGQPVLLLHGFPDTGRMWRKVVPGLVDAGYRCIVPDLRGYGGSDKPADVASYVVPFLAGDVLGLLDHLGLAKAHVVGHDWGAALAWATAAFAPDRVDHLAAVSVGHPAAFRAVPNFAQQEKSWYMLLFQFEGIAERWLSDNDWANFKAWGQHPDHDEVVAVLERDGSLTPGLSWYRANVHPSSLVEASISFPPVQAPTMGVWRTGDFALTEEQMTLSADQCAGGFRYERIDGPGHWIPLEAPDELTRLLIDFLPR